jgi:magnesium-transporting ATPase (P-type)
MSMMHQSTAGVRENAPPGDWHTLSQAQVVSVLQTGTGGLTEADARLRLKQYGPNRLAPPKRRGPWLRLLLQFHNILLYVMMGAAVITALLGHWIDTGVLMMAVVINADHRFHPGRQGGIGARCHPRHALAACHGDS